MTTKLTFHPLGNADCTRIDFANGKKMLIDYADMRNDSRSTRLAPGRRIRSPIA